MNIKIIHKLSEDMARNGVLLLTFSLLLLAVKQASETSTWELIPLLKLIPPPPVCFSTALRIILIVISLIFMIAAFWTGWKKRLNKVAFLIIFFLLLLFVLWLIPPLSICFFTAIGIITLVLSLAFMASVFWKQLACKLKHFLEGYIYWVIFLTVYTIGWLKGLSSVPVESFAFPLVFYLGFVWFFVITIIMFKAAAQSGKHR